MTSHCTLFRPRLRFFLLQFRPHLFIDSLFSIRTHQQQRAQPLRQQTQSASCSQLLQAAHRTQSASFPVFLPLPFFDFFFCSDFLAVGMFFAQISRSSAIFAAETATTPVILNFVLGRRYYIRVCRIFFHLLSVFFKHFYAYMDVLSHSACSCFFLPNFSSPWLPILSLCFVMQNVISHYVLYRFVAKLPVPMN